MRNHQDIQIAFSFPNPGSVTDEFHYSIIRMLMYEMQKSAPDVDPEDPNNLFQFRHLGSFFNQPRGCYVSIHRSKISDDLVSSRGTDTHILMIDPDISFEPDIIDRIVAYLLLEDDPPHIIAGRVNIGNGFPVFYNWEYGGLVQQTHPFNGLREFDRVGTGIIVISKVCLQAMISSQGNCSLFAHIIGPDGREHGDDMSFCTRAKELGFKIFGAWNIVGTHWKVQPVRSNYEEKLEKLAPGFERKK